MSSIHREISFLDQLFEFEEDKLFNQDPQEDYIPNIGEWLSGDQTESIESFASKMREEASQLYGKED